MHHLVRVGALGQIGRFISVDCSAYPRGAGVIVRTRRGLETGEVLAATEEAPAESDGQVLRRVTLEDDLLLARLERNKDEAFDACQQLLAEQGLRAALVDVELLFDGSAIYFYFLGEISPQVEALTETLAERYEAKAQLRQFAETLLAGCGPGCGTEEAAGCGAACSTCAVASACSSGERKTARAAR
jgi:cell fate regulator YaaT (PSP1 superfamily)